MVGDRMDTDVRAGMEAGLETFLVLTGLTKPHQVDLFPYRASKVVESIADLVDRILIYRAPILVGEGKSSFGYIGLDAIGDAHGRWDLADVRPLGIDRLEVYERVRDQDES